MSDALDRPNPRRSADLRASDADRDRVAGLLRDAAGEGRISLDEVDERLNAVYTAKTYGELAEITADLPAATSPGPVAEPAHPAGPGHAYGGAPTSSVAIGILGGFTRRGTWTAPERFTAVTFMGGGEIDLREARFATREITITIVAIMGGVTVIVPEDAEVTVNGVGVMGGFDHSASGPGGSGGPRITITGFAFWGGVATERRPTRAQARERRVNEHPSPLEEHERRAIERERRREYRHEYRHGHRHGRRFGDRYDGY